MTLSHGFRQLANVLENLEANGLEVLDVATSDDDPSERLTVDLTVSVPTDLNASTLESPRSDGGTATSEAAASQPEDSSAGVREQVLDPLAVSADATNGATAIKTTEETSAPDENPGPQPGDGDAGVDDVVDCPVDDCDATFESDHGMRIHRTKVHGDDQDGTDETPSYRDPDRLREVYATCDSFTEMREALETDVSTQTVRRQMIAHDIYEPGESAAGSASTSDDEVAGDDEEVREEGVTAESSEVETHDGNDESEVAVDEDTTDDGPDTETKFDGEDATGDGEAADATETTDGEQATADEESELEAIELPEGVTAGDLRAAVSSAQTLYHVQQRFDLDREAAMELLEAYDLLELVHGRVSNRDLRKQVDEEEITRRILEHAPGTRASQA